MAKELFSKKKVEYVQYDASKFEAICCGSASDGTGSSRLLKVAVASFSIITSCHYFALLLFRHHFSL